MPPFEMWLRGADDIVTWMLGPGAGCRGSRLLPVEANGSPAFAQYRLRADGGREPWALHVLELEDGRVAHISSFLELGQGLFTLMGLPRRSSDRPMSSRRPAGHQSQDRSRGDDRAG